VGTEGKLAGQAEVPGVAGTWKDLTDNVNFMAGNLTAQVRNIAEVATAVARGDLSRKITVDVKGEILELKNTLNTMVDQRNKQKTYRGQKYLRLPAYKYFRDQKTKIASELIWIHLRVCAASAAVSKLSILRTRSVSAPSAGGRTTDRMTATPT